MYIHGVANIRYIYIGRCCALRVGRLHLAFDHHVDNGSVCNFGSVSDYFPKSRLFADF